MTDYSIAQVKKGDVPCLLFRYIGAAFVVHNRITSTTPAMIAKIADPASRRLTMDKALSVIISCQAINKMMGRPLNHGMYED